MKAVSVFAGIGGFDLALERHGVDVVAQVEIDNSASRVLEKHFPFSHLYRDVKEVNGNDLINNGFDPKNGIITGGFPCQDLSIAGARAGLAGSRSGLFFEIARLIDETKTEWFILENVPGLLSSNGGKDMGTVTSTLVELGYSVGWRVLDAQHFGVPQRRRRLFIVGQRSTDPTGVSKVLFERKSVLGYYQESRAERQETPAPLEGSPVARMRGFGDYSDDTIVGALKARDWKDHTDLVYSKTRRAQSSEDFEKWEDRDVTPTLNTFDNGSETRATVLAIGFNWQNGGGYGNANDGLGITEDGTGPLSRSQVPAVATNTVRRLTPLECERLQGFTDNWTEGQADTHRYKQTGNAVAVPVVEWIVEGILDAHGGNNEDPTP